MKDFDLLIEDLGACDLCTKLKNKNFADCSLVNFYSDKNICKKIPSMWTDWSRRLDADIMIIGQDWGPFSEMKRLHEKYLENETAETWEELIETEKSLTKRNLEKFLKQSALSNGLKLEKDFMKKIYITNAIMCARKGNNYRGDNVNILASTMNCMKYLKRQIDIVKPKVIMTLGYYPLLALSKIYDFSIAKNLSSVMNETKSIVKDDFILIPLYHPAAQVASEKQLEQYNLIWQFLKK